MHGKVCLVTGATSGIGEVTARELARLGATVIVVGRNQAKSAAVVENLKQQTGNPNVDFLLADLSSQQEVRALAEAFKRKYSGLHVLVNNAGSAFIMRQQSAEGIEMTFATNHLNYFLLTNLLLEVLKASAPARIVNVSSGIHKQGHIDFDDLQGRRGYNSLRAYQQSKLANLLFTYELARRLAGSGVTVNALNPGVVATNLWTSNIWLGWLLKPALGLFMRSAQEGAQTSIYLASSPEVEGLTGKYFVKEKAAASSAESQDVAVAQRLWQVSAELTSLST